MKRFIKVMGICLLALSLNAAVVSAADGPWSTWNYSDYSKGGYVPKSGSTTSYFWANDFITTTRFQFDANNVSVINDYMTAPTPSPNCSNNSFVTLDMTALPDDPYFIEIGAYVIRTDLPNPKTDLESNNGWDNNESEVVALSAPMAATNYYMETGWNDFRDGGSLDSGKIQVQFAMSDKGVFDYNNCTQSTAIQATINYGDYKGQP